MKRLAYFGLAICMVFALTACTGANSASQGQTEESIAGNVNDLAEDTIELMTADGHIFRFTSTGVDTTAPADGIMIGDTITVYYTGTLDESLDIQTVNIIRMEVKHE